MELDTLNASQLASLTRSIAQQLDKTKKPQNSGKHKDQDRQADPKSAKSKQNSRASAQTSTQLQNGKKGNRKSKAHKPGRGISDPKSASKPKSNGTNAEKVPTSELLQEVIALGGTEEDFKLVGDANSDSDIGLNNLLKTGNGDSDKDLQKDIASFVRELKLNGDSGRETNIQNIKPSKEQKRKAQVAEKNRNGESQEAPKKTVRPPVSSEKSQPPSKDVNVNKAQQPQLVGLSMLARSGYW